jgi:cytoskeleton protein RodZ
MTPVGETLRIERIRRNLDLEQISRELKIATKFLQAIENDQYDKLPGGVFAKSFVRQYARLLGLDDEDMAGQVEQVLAPVELPPVTDQIKSTGVAPIQVPGVEEWETVGDRRFRWSGWLSALLLVVVMLVCSAVYTWIQRPKPVASAPIVSPTQSAEQSAPPPGPAPARDAAAPAPDPVASGGTASPVTPSESAPVPAQAAEQPPAEPPAVAQESEPKPAESKPAEPKPERATAIATPPTPGATVHVEIVADEAAWVSARADGKYKFSGTLEPHAKRTVEAVNEVTLRLGNAGGVTVSVNGKPIGPAGPKGQIRTIQITSGGFTIVPPKPPSAPLDPIGRI